MLIPREVLEVHRIASKDERRPNLNCVHVERSPTPRLVATDGPRLITVTWKEPDLREPAPIDYGNLTEVAGFVADMPVETCVELQRVVPKGDVGEVFRHAWLEETREPGTVVAGAGERTFGQAVRLEAKRSEPDFPDWRAVHGVKGALRIGVNGNLLAELLRVATKVSGTAGVVLHIPSDPEAPIGLSSDSGDGLTKVDGILMPMRLDLTGRPDWEDVPVLPGTPPPVDPPKKDQGELPGTAAEPEDPAQTKIEAPPIKPSKDAMRAVRDFAGVVDGKEITSVTIGTPGGKSVTIDKAAAYRIRKNVDKALAKPTKER